MNRAALVAARFASANPMRWKLIRRRLSVSAPRMIVRSRLPWPLRWAAAALVLGSSAALALWAFEFSKEIAGLDSGAKEELVLLRAELARVKAALDRTQTKANAADSLIKAEQAANEQLSIELRKLQASPQASALRDSA